jgi:hypothetical protein
MNGEADPRELRACHRGLSLRAGFAAVKSGRRPSSVEPPPAPNQRGTTGTSSPRPVTSPCSVRTDTCPTGSSPGSPCRVLRQSRRTQLHSPPAPSPTPTPQCASSFLTPFLERAKRAASQDETEQVKAQWSSDSFDGGALLLVDGLPNIAPSSSRNKKHAEENTEDGIRWVNGRTGSARAATRRS